MTTELNNLRDALLALPPQHVVLLNAAFRTEEMSNVRELVKEVESISTALELEVGYDKVRADLDETYAGTSVTDAGARTMYMHLLSVLKAFETRGTPAPTSIGRETLVWDLDVLRGGSANGKKSRNARQVSLTFGFTNGGVSGRYVIVGITAKRPFNTAWSDSEAQAIRLTGWLQGLMRAGRVDEEDEEDED
ncbi:hypothetical protein D3C87_1291750 [compost metagenome]